MSTSTTALQLLLRMVLGIILSVGIAGTSFGQVLKQSNIGGTGAWNVAGNWSPVGIPATNDRVQIVSGDVVTLAQNQQCGDLYIDAGGTLDLGDQGGTGYTLTVTDSVTINGDVDESGADVLGRLRVGGNFTINSGAAWDVSGNLNIDLEFNGASGTQTVSGTSSDDLFLDSLLINSSSTVDWNLTGIVDVATTFEIASGTFQAGSADYVITSNLTGGVFEISGGTFQGETSSFVLQRSQDEVASFLKTGGTFTAGSSSFSLAPSGNNDPKIEIDEEISFYDLKFEPVNTRQLRVDGDTVNVTNSFERAGRANQVCITFLNNGHFRYSGTTTLIYTYNLLSDANAFVGNEWPTDSVDGPTNVTIAVADNDGVDLRTSRVLTGTLNLQLTGAGDFEIEGASTVLTVYGSIVRQNSGTQGLILASGGTLVYGPNASLTYNTLASANVTIGSEWPDASGPQSVNMNLFGANDSLTINANKTIANTLTLTRGVFNLRPKTVTVQGSVAGSDVAGSGQIAAATTLLIGGAGSTSAQTISGNITLNKLTIDKSAGVNLDSNTVTVTGSLDFSASGTLNVNNGVLAFSGTSGLTGSNLGTLTLNLADGTTLRTAGADLLNVGTIVADTTSTVEFTRATGTEDIPGDTFGNVVIAGGGGATARLNGTLTLTGDFTFNSGSFANNGQAVIFAGLTQQDINGTSDATFGNATINNAAGVRISGSHDPTVTGTLTLTAGIVTVDSARVLTIGSSGSIAGASQSGQRFIDGALARVYPSGSNARTFATGDGQDYRLITVTLNGVATSETVTVQQVNQSARTLSNNFAASIREVSLVRYWTVNPTGSDFTTATVELSYDTLQVSDGVEDANEVRVAVLNGSNIWTPIGPLTGGSADSVGTVTSNSFASFFTGNFTLADTTGGADISLPVELSLFDVQPLDFETGVRIKWRSESEVSNAQWIIERKENEGAFVEIRRVDGQGTKPSATDYAVDDKDVIAGNTYTYRLADVSLAGKITYHPEKTLTVGVPKEFSLSQNFPNPFNPTTSIAYALPTAAKVNLVIYNMLGQKVATLVDGTPQDPGNYRVNWNGRNDYGATVSSGIYIYRLQAGKFNSTKKMTLIK